MPTPRTPGTLVLSLDFELYWGMRDLVPLERYRENLLGVRQAIPAMLELFRRYDIHATWATVGFVFFGDRQSLLAALPERKPNYQNRALSPYDDVQQVGPDEAADPIHFGASMLELVRQCPGQEIASHTFSHYFALEKGQTIEAFEADLRAAQHAAVHLGIHLKSLVFPRNQCVPEYVKAAGRAGFVAYRDNPPSAMYSAQPTAADQSLVRRALRFADAYLPLSSANTHAIVAAEPCNVPASRFLRPYSPALKPLEPLRFRRIAREMQRAAERGELYHLWWHPHNFGRHTAENCAFLERVLARFAELRDNLGMRSLNMIEAAQEALRVEAPSVVHAG